MEYTLHLEGTWSAEVYAYTGVMLLNSWLGIWVCTYGIKSGIVMDTHLEMVAGCYGVYTPKWSIHSLRV